MTIITDKERQRLINGRESDDVATDEHPVDIYRRPRSGVLAALIGMLAGLGLLAILGGITATTAMVSGAELDLIGVDGEELSVLALAVVSIVILVSALVGGFVAGRVAGYGGTATGVGSALWLLVVLVALGGLALMVNEFSPVVERVDVADRVATALQDSDVAIAAAIAGGGLLLLSLGMGVLGGRLGETERAVGAHEVVDIRDDTD